MIFLAEWSGASPQHSNLGAPSTQFFGWDVSKEGILTKCLAVPVFLFHSPDGLCVTECRRPVNVGGLMFTYFEDARSD